jgi:hypothetical protein
MWNSIIGNRAPSCFQSGQTVKIRQKVKVQQRGSSTPKTVIAGRNKNASSTKQNIVMEFYGLPPIGQKQRRPMDGAQFHTPRVGEAGGRSLAMKIQTRLPCTPK